ncbi:hydrolase [Ferrimonas sediminicola]|uniref:Hydrolase n=1 Tax=Ferrimonas sediminicola TaxID=2569538 RepID=A0A4U1BAZ3_9GAMM|nr:hydrolase [Ferrimonas sediminicola]TKB48047.1 hydrolase [Ferrimonas sediminicola]
MTGPFTPSLWWRNPHLQTIWPLMVRPAPLPLTRQRFTLDDGDFLQLDWLNRNAEGPLYLILHGLEGGADSHYVRRMLHRLNARNACALVMHQRSCGGELNRLPRTYHSGETADLGQLLSHLTQRFGSRPILAVGYSLGGNLLCKYLGERGEASLIRRAVAVSPPLDLAACARRMERGFSRLYQHHLLTRLRGKIRQKLNGPHASAMPIDLEECDRLTTFYQFDHRVTAPLHGFDGADDYYRRASGKQFLKGVRTPLLVLHAADDPFMTAAVIPAPHELAASVTLELCPFGGHVGFISGGPLWRPTFYLEPRALSFLNESP